MRIKRLKLAGFKSFVEPAELRIEPGLTGVVGPNGCGKSNLLEAIRWVMGESSPKSMRGGAMDDVIFAGTDFRPARDFAEVAILGERDAAELAGDIGVAGEGEIEIVRRIERGAGSAWRVNGRDVRAKDVALVFADAATGAHSPALVSQGRIGAVIAARPDERRAMLEEAAGVAGLHVRRKDAEQKLRATEANLSRLDDLLGDMETRANALRRQARAAKRYRALTEAIGLAEGRLVFARWRDAALGAEAALAEAEAAETRVADAAEAQRAAAVHQADAARKAAELRSAAQSLREAALAIGHELAAANSERAALERRIGELASRREALVRDRTREDALAGDAAEALDRLGAEEKALTARLVESEGLRTDIETRVAETETVSRDIELALARALAAQAAQQADARVAAANAEAARQRQRRAEDEAARVTAESDGLGALTPHEQARDEAAEARGKAEAAAAAARAAIDSSDLARVEAGEVRDTAESASSAARAGLSALEAEARALERALSGDASDKLLARIRPAPGYEAALAAALGDDLEAGLEAGAARRWAGADRQAGDPALPAGTEPLGHHVDAPAALARRLAQVGVVDVDNGGIVLAAGQRLVTRDGRLRRWDGYVATGEGAAAAERLVRANRLDALHGETDQARAALESAAARATAALAALTEASTANEDARASLSQAEARVRDAQRAEDAALAAIDRLEAQREALAGRAERAAAEVGEALAALDRAEIAARALPDPSETDGSVDRLRERSEAARVQLGEARSAAATLAQSIDANAARLAAARAEAASWRARAGDAAKRVQEMAKRAEEAQAEAELLTDAPKALEERIADLTRDATTADAAAEEARAAERAGEDRVAETDRLAAVAVEALSTAREDRAGASARRENAEARRREMERIADERFQCAPAELPGRFAFEADAIDEPQVESARLDSHTAERERLGPVNLVADSELESLDAERAASLAEREELGQAINRLRGSIGGLNREGRARLLAAFEEVDRHFRRLFATLFEGGAAHLALVDADDPLEAGLEIYAQPPGKKLAALTLLSGGEQALTAIALIFALFLTNPAPICVLDEVDAPLDDANIDRFCDLLDRMTEETDTRYLIVTHNAVTMARMHRLFGVTMAERGVSRLVSVDLGGAETLLAAE